MSIPIFEKKYRHIGCVVPTLLSAQNSLPINAVTADCGNKSLMQKCDIHRWKKKFNTYELFANCLQVTDVLWLQYSD